MTTDDEQLLRGHRRRHREGEGMRNHSGEGMRNHSLQQAINNLAALFDFGALKASTAPAEFMDDARKEILCLRAELAALRERAERAEAEAAGLRADAERWRAVSAMMTHEHRGDAVGWTLSVLLPGDDPDAAIDAARGE